VSFGASPRGPISLVQSARALALIHGRDYVILDDLRALAKDALRHRLVLSYQALAEEVSPDTILDRVLEAVPVPQIDLARTTAA
jgi:MoxR-like ATPase